MTAEETYKNISALLDEIEKLSKAEVFCSIETESTKIWKHTILFPRKETEEFYMLLPNKLDILPTKHSRIYNSKRYYIIDCFKKYESHKNAINPRSFFVNFIFNSNEYGKYLKEDTIFSDIKNLYVNRTISYFNDEECLFEKTKSENLEAVLDKWKTNGEKPILLMGERGMGKSWAALNFCLKNYKLHIDSPWENPLPIYINLRGLSENIPGVTNLGELLFYHLKKLYDFKIFGGQFTFISLLNSGKIILVLDGLDEMSKEISTELTIKNLWQIFSLYSNTSKFLLTSRSNFFNTRMQIKEHFSFSEYNKLKSQSPYFKEDIYNIEERRVRQDFNIWEINQFEDNARLKLLNKALKLNDSFLEKGIEKLKRLEEYPIDSIEHEIVQLWYIPGYFLPLNRLLASNQAKSKIEIYEQCINSVIIEFNIDTDRAIDKYKTLDKSQIIHGHFFKAEQKNEILRKLAWYMVERELDEFDIIEFPKFIKEIDGNDYDIVLNDLQTQTVITLKEEGKYSFITESIFAFYAANFLFRLLTNENDEFSITGLRNIGRYSFLENRILKKAKIFLKAKIDALKSDLDGRNEIGNWKIKSIEDLAVWAFNNDRPYSIWLKHLSSNLESIGIQVDRTLLSERDFWTNNPISSNNNKTDKKMIMILGNGSLNPFFISTTEVTNKEYHQFILSNEFDGSDGKEECLGKYWKRKEIKRTDNPYNKIINDYHIIFWTNETILPSTKQDHPIVWVSWFAAAKYCNWLSRKEGIYDLYYNFEFDTDNQFKRIILNKKSNGYRLPTSCEWIFAASEGKSNVKTILDLYSNDKEKEKAEKKFSEIIDTTVPVKSENPNQFGVYGLVGNVREWVDNPEIEQLDKYTPQLIKGMGWLLGNEGRDFNHSSPLIAQNNNVDVGFRIARSLTKEEVQQVNEGYQITSIDIKKQF